MHWQLAVDYYHVVFTLPHSLNGIMAANLKLGLQSLLHCANQTLVQIMAEQFGCKPGLSLVLHTWGQEMLHHFHVHVAMTAGGVAIDKANQRWIKVDSAALQDVHRQIMLLFQQKFLRRIKWLYAQGKLKIPEELEKESDPNSAQHPKGRSGYRGPTPFPVIDLKTLKVWLAPLAKKDWYLYSERRDEESVVSIALQKYLSQYVYGTCIHDSRIVSDDGQFVTIRCKDYKRQELGKTAPKIELKLKATEFVRRFSLHLLPSGVHRVRYGGIYHASKRNERLEAIRKLLPVGAKHSGVVRSTDNDEATSVQPPKFEAQTTCNRCGSARMQLGQSYNPSQTRDRLARLRQIESNFTTPLTTLDQAIEQTQTGHDEPLFAAAVQQGWFMFHTLLVACMSGMAALSRPSVIASKNLEPSCLVSMTSITDDSIGGNHPLVVIPLVYNLPIPDD